MEFDLVRYPFALAVITNDDGGCAWSEPTGGLRAQVVWLGLDLRTPAQSAFIGKKVKFSHTRYRALGPELIPVYRQSARR